MDILHFTDYNNNKLFNFDYWWLITVSIIFQSYQGPMWPWSYGSCIYLCNPCLSPQKLYVRTPFMARCIRYIIWCSLPVTFDSSVVLSGYSDYHHPWYNWNIVESRVKHYKPNQSDISLHYWFIGKVLSSTENNRNATSTGTWTIFYLHFRYDTHPIFQNDIYCPKYHVLKQNTSLKRCGSIFVLIFAYFGIYVYKKRIVKLIYINIIIP